MLLLALGACVSPPDREFYVKRRVFLPTTNAKPAVQFVKEPRHLLQAPNGAAARNRRAMDLALAGKWTAAGRIWESLARGGDCRVLNNLGVARDMQGMNRLAMNDLARAHALCGDDDRIRWNYRSVLGSRARSVARYRIRDDNGATQPRPTIDSRSEARKAAREKARRERLDRLRRREAARRAKEQERKRAREAEARRRAEAVKRAAARRRAEAERKRLDEERKRQEAERKRLEDERKRREAERKRREAERKREPNTYFDP